MDIPDYFPMNLPIRHLFKTNSFSSRITSSTLIFGNFSNFLQIKANFLHVPLMVDPFDL